MLQPSPPTIIRWKRLTRGLLAFAIVGSVGAVAGICTVVYCLWTGVCFGKKKIHNFVQPKINGSNRNGSQRTNGSPISRSATIRRQLSRGFRRQRSRPSSKQAEKEEEFTFADLALATNNFSPENKIGAGSFGVVYRGKLLDGREVAIKRGEISDKTKKLQEKESAFDSELGHTLKVYLPECNLQKDAWKAELRDFSNKNGYDINRNGDSGPLLLDVLEGFLKFESQSQGRGSVDSRNRRPSPSSVVGGLAPLGRQGPSSQTSDRRGGSSTSSYRNDDYNWRYENDDTSNDINHTSAALENLQLDRKARNFTPSWRHGGDGSNKDHM